MLIRPARPTDAARLTAIAHAAKRHWGYPERWLERWREELTITPELLAEHPAFCAEANGTVLGFCVLALDGVAASLDHFWILPEAMGRGLGRQLFGAATRHASEAGATHLLIESDPNAEGFYRHLGARPHGEVVYALDGQPRRLPVLRFDLSN